VVRRPRGAHLPAGQPAGGGDCGWPTGGAHVLRGFCGASSSGRVRVERERVRRGKRKMVLGFSVVVYSFGWSDCCGQEIDGVDAGWFPHTPTRACFFS
jgi:hypothetical protein